MTRMKAVISVVAAVAISTAMSMTSMAASVWTYGTNQYGAGYNVEVPGEWKQDNAGWWFAKSSGGWCQNEWVFYNGEVYYFNGNGYMATNQWVSSGGNWYYMKDTGIMAMNETTPDGYYVDYDGIWQQNSTSGGSISNGNSSSSSSSSNVSSGSSNDNGSSSDSTTTHTQTYLRAVDDLDAKYDTTDITPELIVEAINDWRALYGEYRYDNPIGAVEMDDELSAYAEEGVEAWIDFGITDDTAHIRSDGTSATSKIHSSFATEISLGKINASATVRDCIYYWANSNWHRTSMATKSAKSIGVGVNRESGVVVADLTGKSFTIQ